jgi:hypothetical protein
MKIGVKIHNFMAGETVELPVGLLLMRAAINSENCPYRNPNPGW